MYIAHFHYTSQNEKVKSIGVPLPFIGHLIQILFSRNDENKHQFIKLIENKVGGNNFNKTTVIFAGSQPIVALHDVKALEQLYTTHNVHFDKHPSIQLITLPLTGKSILFDETSTNWRQRRKAMSPAFYKGKLHYLIEIASSEVKNTIKRFDML